MSIWDQVESDLNKSETNSNIWDQIGKDLNKPTKWDQVRSDIQDQQLQPHLDQIDAVNKPADSTKEFKDLGVTFDKPEELSNARKAARSATTVGGIVKNALLHPADAALSSLLAAETAAINSFHKDIQQGVGGAYSLWKAAKSGILAASIPPDIPGVHVEVRNFGDLLEQVKPEWSKEHPVTKEILGLGLDVVANPVNAFSLGPLTTGKVIGQAEGKLIPLEKSATGILKELIAKGEESPQLAKMLEGQSPELIKRVKDVLKLAPGQTQVALPDAETALTRMIEAVPEIAAKYVDKGGLKIFGKTVISEKFIDDLVEKAGLGKSLQKVMHPNNPLSRIQGLENTKEGGVDYWWVDKARVEAIGKMNVIDRFLETNTTGLARQIVKGKPEAFEKVKDVINNLADLKTAYVRNLTLPVESGGLGMGEKAANTRLQQVMRDIYSQGTFKYEGATPFVGADPEMKTRVQDLLNTLSRDNGELDLFNSFNSLFGTAKLREMEMKMKSLMFKGLTEEEAVKQLSGELERNFYPSLHERMKDPDREIRKIKAKLLGVKEIVPSLDPETKYITTKDINMDQMQPEMNPFVYLLQRLARVEKRRALEETRQVLLSHFGDDANVPDKVIQDFKLIGGHHYYDAMDDLGNKIYDAVASVNRFATGAATRYNPSFPIKQVGQNTLQNLLVQGLKSTVGFFDPRRVMDAAIQQALRSNWIKEGSAMWEKAMSHPIKNLLGEMMTRGSLFNEQLELNIAPGQDITGAIRTGKRISEKLLQLAGYELKHGDGSYGMHDLLTTAVFFPDHASFVEDFYHRMLYNQLRMKGYNKFQAAKEVKNTYFDYINSFTEFEYKKLKKTFLMFYSYPRFAIPMVAKLMVTKPGNVSNLYNASKDFMKVWEKVASGRPLTEDEKSVLPPYKIDQPSVFDAEDHKIVTRMLDNFNPLDMMSTNEVGADGTVNWQKTILNRAISHVTKFIQVPFEIGVNRDFFTNKALYGDELNGIKAEKKINATTPKDVLENIAAMIAGAKFGYAGVAAPKLIGALPGGKQAMEQAGEWFKKISGWNESVDPYTNERKVYLAPFRTWVAAQIYPQLNKAIRISSYDNPIDKALDFFVGIPTQRVRGDETFRSSANYMKSSKLRVEQAIKDAELKGKKSEAAKLREQLNQLLEIYSIKFENDRLNKIKQQEGIQ